MSMLILNGKKSELRENGKSIPVPGVAIMVEYNETLYGPFKDEDAALEFGFKLESSNWRVRPAYTPE